jgi:hypothetical protein
MNRKLVSVITGTYNRPKLINQCIDEVRKQTYPNIEHCIVSDGPDKLLRIWHEQGWPQTENKRNDVPIKFVETGRQWSQFLTLSVSAVPFQVAQWLSSGDYICWFADDEEMTADHIESLVDLLEKEDVDFVFSKTEVWFPMSLGRVFAPRVIGSSVPKCGDITQALFRVELLDYRGFNTHVGSGTDWDQVGAWIDSGASYAFLDRVTHTHRVDKWGDTGANTIKQPLRGQINAIKNSTIEVTRNNT